MLQLRKDHQPLKREKERKRELKGNETKRDRKNYRDFDLKRDIDNDRPSY